MPRGHRDNITDIEKDVTSSMNHSNFWALLNFRIDAGDKVLEDHLRRNATYSYSKPDDQYFVRSGKSLRR